MNGQYILLNGYHYHLPGNDLDGIIAEIDTDGSGTVDFDGK